MADTMFGSDITLVSMETRSAPSINEMKILEVLEPYNVKHGGKVKHVSFTSGSV